MPITTLKSGTNTRIWGIAICSGVPLKRVEEADALAYYSVNRDAWAGRQHPEWRMKDAGGRIVDEERWPPEWAAMGFMCYNSPYRDYVKAQVEEIMEYDVEGFHFDMLWFGTSGKVCYCQEYCRPLFRQKYGIDMTPSRPGMSPGENFWSFAPTRMRALAKRSSKPSAASGLTCPSCITTTRRLLPPGRRACFR